MKTFTEFLNESIDEMSNMKINKAYSKIRSKYNDARDDKYKNITKNSGHVFYKDEDYEVRVLSQNMLEHIVSIAILERKTKIYRSITCEKYKIGFFNVSLKGFRDVKPLEFINNLNDNIINKIIDNINIALKINITFEKFIKAVEKAAKKYEKFNENEVVDEDLLGQKALMAAKSVN